MKTSYTGILLSIKTDIGFRKEGHRYHIVKAVTEKLLQDKCAMIFIIFIGFGMIFPGLASPVFSQIFLDEILMDSFQGSLNNLIGLGSTLQTTEMHMQRFDKLFYEIRDMAIIGGRTFKIILNTYF